VDSALAGPLIRSPTISAGFAPQNQMDQKSTFCKHTYNQVIPSHPTAKKELNTKRRTALITRAAELLILPNTARKIMVMVCPADPKNINLRRPTLSIRTMATNDARKYSVALHAAMMRDLVSEICRRSNKRVCI